MRALSGFLYTVAWEFTDSMSKGEKFQRIKYPSAAVILLVACLESYLNESLSLFRQMEAQKWGAAISELDEKELETRWMRAPLIFGTKTFVAGKEPFQSFHLLVCLRNALAHYDPRFRTPVEFPSDKIERLKTKFVFSYESKSDWTSQVLNLDCARWACKTTKAMVRKFHEFVGGHDMSGPPYPWPDAD
jgi:hypothetical protein